MPLPVPANPFTIDALARQMTDRQGVWWAAQSAKTVPPGSTPSADQAAVTAAEAWAGGPSPGSQDAGAGAASKTDFQGPGAWAAQAAAWAKPAPPAGARADSPVVAAPAVPGAAGG